MKRAFLGVLALSLLPQLESGIALAADPFAIAPALNSQAVFSCRDFTASGNSNVIDSVGSSGGGVSGNQAHVVSNGNIVLNGSTTIYGNAIAGPGMHVTTNGGATVLGTQSANTSPVDCRPIDLASLADSLRLSNDNATIPLTAQGRSALTGGSLTDFSLRSGDSITLTAGRYFFTSIDVGSGSIVKVGGPVDILSAGNVSINGGSQFNASGNAYSLSFWCSGATFDLQSDKSVLSAFVYAPSADVGVKGGARVIGGVFAGSVTITGGSRISRSVDQSLPLTISFTEGGATLAPGKAFNRNVVPVVVLNGGSVPRFSSLTLNGTPFVSGTTVSAEGNYSLAAIADDAVGRHLVATVSFSIDKTPPLFISLTPPDGSLLRTHQQVLTGTTDATSASVNGVAATISGGTFVAQVSLVEGSNAITISGIDAAGNAGGASIRWTIDTVAPAISIQSPADGFLTKGSAVSVSGTVGDASAVSVSVNGVPASVSAGSFSVGSVNLVEGSNPIVATAADAVGNSSISTITVVRDTTPPSLDVLDGSVSISDGALFNHQPIPTIFASDAHLNTVTSTLNGAPFLSGTIIVSDGSYDLAVVATDKVGNSTRKEVRFAVDTAPPALSILNPANGALLGVSSISVSGSCGDAVTVTVNGVPALVSGGQFHLDTMALPEGTATITVLAIDSAGNSAMKSVTVVVDTTPPSISLAAPADHSYVGSIPFSVTGVATDAHLQSTTVNGTPVVVGQDGVFQTTLSAADGPFTVTAIATDGGGRTASAVASVTIDTKTPTIAITSAGSPLSDGFLTNRPVTPVIQVTDASPVTTDIRLNGAPFVSGSPVSADGAYRLDVTAKDAAGNVASQTVTFSVDSQPPKIASLLPTEGSILKPGPVTVSGSCEDAVSVKINGVLASVSNGTFSLSGVSLAVGSNVLAIIAADSAGNSGTATLTLTGDGDPPVVTITSPAANLLTKTSTVTVVGSATDAHLSSVTVNNAPAALAGSNFTRTGVNLTEGDNLIDAVATDAAGNSGEAKETITLDTTPPILAITSPVAGAILGLAKVDVSGNVSDSHLDTVSVNGIAATVSAGHFVAAGVPLTAGANTLTATAADKAGNGSTAAVTISYDDRAPIVSIASPKDGARLRSQPITVSGSVEGGTGLTLTVNGQTATIAGESFNAIGVPLNEGNNVLTARATNDSGKDGVATISVLFDDVAPTVTSVSPSDGAFDLPLSTVVRVVFSEPLDPATVTNQALTVVRDGSGAVSGKLALDGATATFVPDSGFAEKAAFTITATVGLTDPAGNPLVAPVQSHFRTGSATAPDPPALDSLKTSLCATTISVSGSTEPFFRISISGGAALATGTADSGGRFSIPVTLSANSQNVLSVVVTDTQSRSSSPATVTVTADCVAPTVDDAVLSGPNLVVTFSEAIAPASLVAGSSVTLIGTAGELAKTVALSPDGLTGTVVGTVDLSTARFQLTVSTGVTDLAVNPLAAPFVKSFSPGGSAVLGEVYDDAVGRPMPGATATLVSANGSPPAAPVPVSSSETDGQFALEGPSGELVVSVSKPGYTTVFRTVVADPDTADALFDVRLTPFVAGSAAADGSAALSDGPLQISIPASGIAAGAPLAVANLSAQALPALMPLGWTSIAAVDFETGDAALAVSATATWPNSGFVAGTSATLVSFDAATRRWIASGTVRLSIDGKSWQASIPASGIYALILPDPAPFAPPDPVGEQALLGVGAPADDSIVSADVTPNPAAVLPQQTDTITVKLSTSAPVPSGYPIQALVSETLTRLDGQIEEIPDFLSDFVVQRSPAGDPIVVFRIKPSPEASQVALSVGFEKIRVKHYPFEVRRGDLVPPSGATVAGPGGFSVTIPGGAVSDSIPVAISPLAQVSDLPISVPAGYRFVAALNLSLGETTLTQGATLRFKPVDGSSLDSSAQFVWIRADELANRLVPRFVSRVSYDPASGSVASINPDPDLPVPGIREEGTYVLLAANGPISFATGHVFDVDGSALPAAVVTESGTALVQIADGSGAFAILFPSAGSTLSSLRAATGNVGSVAIPATSAGSVVSADVRLQITAPFVVSVSPDGSTPVSPTSTIAATFSEPVDPLSIGAGNVTLTFGGTPIDGSVQLAPSGTQVTFIPSNALPSNIDVQFRIASTVKDLTGYGLVDAATRQSADFVRTFHTFDNTPPAGINPLAIVMGMPSGSPSTVHISGRGAVCGSCTVTAVDDTTQATASTTANAAGDFDLDLRADATDAIYLVISKSNGTQIRVNPGPFRDPNGTTAVVGGSAEDYVTSEGIRLTFPDGTFNAPTTALVTKVVEGQAPAPVPADARFVGGIRFDIGSLRSNNPIDFGVPAPPGAQAGDTFFAAVPVDVLGQKYYMVLDTARLDGSEVTTRPATAAAGASLQLQGRSSTTRSAGTIHFRIRPQDVPGPSGDPKLSLPRISESSTIILLEHQRAYDFVAGQTSDPAAVVLANSTPYVWDTRRAYDKNFFLLPVPQGQDYQLTILDSVTGFTRFQGNFSAPSDPKNVTRLPDGATAGSDTEPPRLLAAVPASVVTFTPLPTTGGPGLLAPSISYAFVQDPSGSSYTLTVTGTAGAIAAGGRVSLADNERVGTTGPVASGADGSFSISVTGAQNQPGSTDDFTLVLGVADIDPGASIHLQFSESLGGSQDLSGAIVLTRAGSLDPLASDLVFDSDSRGVTLFPSTDFLRGTSYILTLVAGGAGLKDSAGNVLRSSIVIPLDSPAAGPVGKQTVTDVNDMAQSGGLLFEATETGTLGLYSAGDPGAIAPCGAPADFSGSPLRGVAFDPYGRAVVAGGGGSTIGFVGVVRLAADSSNGCGYRLAYNSLARTNVASVIGDDASPLPEGFPRRVKLLSDDKTQSFVLDSGNPPTGISITETPDPDHPGKQKPASPLSITVLVATGARNHPVKVANRATGESKVAFTDDSGSVTLSVTASSGDAIDVKSNASLLAVVVNQGFGMDVVDVNATDLVSGQLVLTADKRLLTEFDGTYPSPVGKYCGDDSMCPTGFVCHGDLSDITDNYCYIPFCQQRDGYGNCVASVSGLFGLNDLDVIRTDDGKFHVLNAINHFGLVSWNLDISDSSHPFHYESQLRLGDFLTGDQFLSMATVENLELKPAAERKYCRGRLGETASLAFLASSTAGFYVVDVTDPVHLSLTSLVGRYDTDGQVSRFGVDPLHDLLYVADGGQGVKVYDISDPCTSGVASLADPRLIANIATGGNANVPFIVDPETGIAFGSAQNTSASASTVFTFSFFPPPISFVADTDRDGQWEQVTGAIPLGVKNVAKTAELAKGAGHGPYPADTVRILANLAGGAGQNITMEVDSANPGGFTLPPAPPGFPAEKNFVQLRRQSDDAADPAYNRYLSPLIVLLADPRAQAQYARAAAEVDSSNPYACANCTTASDYAGELGSLSSGSTAGTRSAPASGAVEQMAGDLLVARLNTATTSTGPLIQSLSYLRQADIDAAEVQASAVRMDWTPGLKQAPAQNPSTGAGTLPATIFTHSGESALSFTDLVVRGRSIDFAVSRNYASQAAAFGPLGRNWDSPLFARLRTEPDGSIDFYDGSGRRDTFKFVSDPSSVGHFEAPPGIFLGLYRRADGRYLLQDSARHSLWFESDGRLLKINDRYTTFEDDRNGNIVRYGYDGRDRLVTVTDTLGHVIVFDYYPDSAAPGAGGAYPGLLRSATDHTGRQVVYQYDSSARLVEADLPEVANNGLGPNFAGSNRRKWKYSYAPPGSSKKELVRVADNITGVSDPRGNAVVSMIARDAGLDDVADAVTDLTWGGAPLSVSYDLAGLTTTVTDRRGKHYAFVHDVQGHATSIKQTDLNLTWTATFDSEGRLTESHRPLGDGESLTYSADRANRNEQTFVTSRTELGKGSVAKIPETLDYYFLPGQLKSYTDMIGSQTSFTRNPTTGALTVETDPSTRDQNSTPAIGRTVIENLDTGDLTAETDKFGTTTAYTYFPAGVPAAGYVQTATRTGSDGAAQSVTYERDARGNVTAMIDARGVRTEFVVNEADQIVEEKRATTASGDGAPALSIDTRYGYDEDGNRVAVQRPQTPLGNLTDSATYDVLSRPLTTTTALGGAKLLTEARSCDPNGNLLSATSPEGRVRNFLYDEANRLVRESTTTSSGDALIKKYTLDDDGKPTALTDELNTTETVAYDPFERPQTVIHPDLSITTYSYTDRDEVSTMSISDSQAGVLHTVGNTYTPHGELTNVVENWGGASANLTTDIFYNSLGLERLRVAPLGHTTFTTYDGLGRRVESIDAFGNRVKTDLDSMGNPIRTTETEQVGANSEQFVTTRKFDALGRILSITDPGDHTVSSSYDEPGHVLSSTDALGNVTKFVWDGAGRKTDDQMPENRNVHYDLDGDGLLVDERDGLGNVSQMTHDEAARKTSLTFPDGKAEAWTYNLDGTVATHKNANSFVEAYTYDGKDRPVRVDVTRQGGVSGARYEAYAYDALDRITHEETDSATGSGQKEVSVDRTYGNAGALLTERENGRTLSRTLDDLGRTTVLQIPGAGLVGRSWDAIDRIATLTLDDSSVATFGYRGPSRIDNVIRGTGVSTQASYDTDRRLAGLLTRNATTNLLSFGGGYDARHLLTSEDRGGVGDAFGYDKAGRLTQSGLNQASPANGLSLAGDHFNTALDPAENWTYLDKQFGGQTATVPVSLNSRNQYTSFGAPQTFDPQGNLTSDPNGTYTFDFKNRLIEADLGSGTKLFYVYDPENRLVKKTTEIGTDSKVEETLWEGWEPAARYINGALIEEDVSIGSPDSILALRTHSDDGSTSLFNLHSDLRGDTAGLTDQTGTLLEKYRYTPYGEFLITDGSDTRISTSRTNRLFQGLTFDADLGWYYARNRYYDPHEGRFRTQDPLGLSAGQNEYAFAGDGPIMGRDALGLFGAFFDGSWNDKGDPNQIRSNVARLFGHYAGSARYYRGVSGITGGLFGSGTEEIAEKAYWEFVRVYNDHRSNSAEDMEARTLDVFGFSRGSTGGRSFLNKVYQRGIPDLSSGSPINDPYGRGTIADPVPGTTTYSRLLARGSDVRIRFVGLFDSVDSRGFPGATPGVGWLNDQRLPGTVERGRQAAALGEFRHTFPLTHLDSSGCSSGGRFAERYFPGAHSDVGGGNSETNIISRWTLGWMWDEANRAGVPLTALLPHERVPANFGSMRSDAILVEGAVTNSLIHSAATAPLQWLKYSLGFGAGSRPEVSPGGCAAVP